MKHLLTIICVFTCVFSSNAQWSKSPIQTDEIRLNSKLNNRTYKISVALPSSYSKQHSYPVFYLLDGYYAFPIAKESMKALKMGNLSKDFILVSIAGDETTDYDWLLNRWTDYTFTQKNAKDREYSQMWNFSSPALVSGGGDVFYKIITNEIIPLIDSTYSTTNERGLSGHSLSGLYVANVMLKSDGVFTKFGINSPSFLFWDNDIMQIEAAYASSHSTLKADVFFSIAELEDGLDNLLKFEALLKKYQGFSSKLVVFKDETHNSVGPAMISRTMRVLYSK